MTALAKRWLFSTYQGAVDHDHLAGYPNEFVFRFNRRTSRSRGLVFHRVLELAVDHDPVRYRAWMFFARTPPTVHQSRGQLLTTLVNYSRPISRLLVTPIAAADPTYLHP